MKNLQSSCGQVKKCDAKVTIDLENDGIDVIVISKFDKMFGTHMKHTVKQVLMEKDIVNAKVTIEDDGALDFTIRARTLTALRRIGEGLVEKII